MTQFFKFAIAHEINFLYQDTPEIIQISKHTFRVILSGGRNVCTESIKQQSEHWDHLDKDEDVKK